MNSSSKMSGKSSKKADAKANNDGEDLCTILDESQRSDLTALIANITQSMRRLILDNFDATIGFSQSSQQNMTEDEKLMQSDPKADVEKQAKQKKLQAEYQKDLSSTKMKSLKQNTLQAFDEWREQVVNRVAEAVHSQDTAQAHLKEPARPSAPTTIGTITDTPAPTAKSLKFKDLYPPVKNSLTKLSMDRRTLILHAILLLLLSLEHYPATSRILLLNLTSSLKLPLKTFEQDEYITAKGLLENAKELSATEETSKRAEENQEARKKKVRYAAIAGAAIIGVAGGFAAPLLAAGIGSVATGLGLGTTAAAGYLGTLASSSLLVGSLFGAYGGRMTGQMMDKYAREVQDFEFLPVHSPHRTSEDPKKGAEQASQHDHRLRITICLSGWLREKEEVVKPWRVVGTGAEVFALKYELEALLKLGHAMDGMVQSAAWGYAQRELIQRTVFADLMAALWPVGLIKMARVIDNPFSVAKVRAEKVGEVLADALINKVQGERPVTLIGYSLGARAIYICLQRLAERKAFNLVENAVLIGAPTPSDTSDWRVLRSAVAGRLVNVYSSNDYVLGFMYRTSAIQYGVAGLQAVENLAGVENVDVSEDVDGHLRYRFLIGGILKKIGFEDVDLEAVKEEQAALVKMKKEEEKNSLQAQRKRFLRQESYRKDGKVDEDAQAEDEASEIENEVTEKTKRSLVSRVIEWWYTPKGLPNTRDAEKVASNLQRAMQNPSDAGAAASDTVQDIRDSTSSMAQRVYQALPNIPYMSGSGFKEGKSETNPQDAAQSQSYTSRAAAYLPQSMPSMPRMSDLPSMPNIPGYSKKDTSSKPAKLVKDAGTTSKKTTKAATDTIATTVKNAGDINNNPATKQLGQTPGIKQVVERDPGVTQTLGKLTGLVGTTVRNTTDQVTGATGTITDKAGKGGGKAVDAIDSGTQKTVNAGKSLAGAEENQDRGQSYTSYAASYLPSLPSWGSKPAKLERKGSQNTSQVSQPKPPKLERRGSSQTRSPPPKLGPRKASDSGARSPLQRMASGEVSGLPNIAENLPSAKDANPQAAKKASEVASQGADAAGNITSQGQQSAKKGIETAQKSMKSSQDAATNLATSASNTATQTARSAQSGLSKATNTAQDSLPSPVQSGLSNAAKTGQESASNVVGSGTAATKSIASQGQQAASSGVSAAQGAFSSGKKMFGLR